MQSVNGEIVKNLRKDPVSVAMMMDNGELEQIIAAFVSVLNQRTKDRGGQN